MRLGLGVTVVFLALVRVGFAQEADPKMPIEKNVEQLAESTKKSLAVILYTSREGKKQGIGTGFVIDAKGLIATNFHVIGEARPITVKLQDGREFQVDRIQASDRHLDLAVIHIPVENLVPIPLGDSSNLKQGQPIVVMGHPRGLEYSVVAGVLSGRRDVEGVSMLQLAMPIEEGNSGGPVLDMQGRALGIVTMKSLVTKNLGFAIPIDSLKAIVKKPNPVAMEQWLTIGALAKADWQNEYGGRWRQRAGRIIADGSGEGFGGRTLCFWQRETPKLPFEVTVTVRLDDESGAAGLFFGGDDRDQHYGFYPSGGKLRLTRFQGANVFSWKILRDEPHPAYRPGEWNTLRVRLEADKFRCYVNEQLFVEWTDANYAGERIGLAKFRDTVAEFKRFQVAPKVALAMAESKTEKSFQELVAKIPATQPLPEKFLDEIRKATPFASTLLRDQARDLEKKAAQLRKWAGAVHHQRVLAEIAREVQVPEEKVDLGRAVLLIAKLDNEDLDVDAYRSELDRLANLIRERFPKDATLRKKFDVLSQFLFKERGFHGSRHEYYTRANSYLNEVIDDREGLPITLSVLVMELARRVNVKVEGVPLPGHFMVRLRDGKDTQLIDVYESGKLVSEADAKKKVLAITGRQPEEADFQPVGPRAILTRVLHNLFGLARSEMDKEGMLRYLDAILVIDPDSHDERWARAVFRYQNRMAEGAAADCDYLLEKSPPGLDLPRVRELRRVLEREER